MTLVQALEKTAAFFRLPYVPYDPEAELRREGPGTWPRLVAATWIMMTASLIATWSVVPQPWLIIEMAVILASALPVAYRLHYLKTSRLIVNWLSFTSALVLGLIQLRLVWPLSEGFISAESFDSMAFLVTCFMWVTVFRAFTLRTVTDLVQTILPCGSVILLVLLLRPSPLDLGCTAIVVLSTLALLSAEYRLNAVQVLRPLASIRRTQDRRQTGIIYSWPTLYALVLLVSVGVAWTAARTELSGGWGDVVRAALARQVYRFMQPREVAAMVDNAVVLPRLTTWPNRDLIVFTVRTERPAYWRTHCYHGYNGWRWERGRMRLLRARTEGAAYVLPMEGSGAARTGAIQAEFEVTPRKYLLGVLPTPFCPVSVTAETDKLSYDSDRCVHITRWLRVGEPYLITAYIPPVVPVVRPGIEVPTEELALDLALPDTLPQRVRDLAQRLTASASTPLEKIREIENYLSSNYEYTLEVDSSGDNDFVDHFLFVSKKGFCHHFAGSMVVMCRALGFPARLAGGYLEGEQSDQVEDLYIIREKDAHVWPEVYFRGAGWVAFEPTPPTPEERRPLTEAWERMSQAVVIGAQSTGHALYRYWPLGLGLLMITGGSVIVWRITLHHRLPQGFQDHPDLGRLVRAYLRMRVALGRHGAPVHAHLGPREVLALLPLTCLPAHEPATNLTEQYLAARFGKQQVGPEEARVADALQAEVRRLLRQRSIPVPKTVEESNLD